MSSKNIFAAMETHLAGMAGVPDIAYVGTSYEPSPGTPYLDPVVVSATTEAVTSGPTGDDEYTGRYQINIYSPIGNGMGETMTIADAIESRFSRSAMPSLNGTVVQIKSATTLRTTREGGWLITPVEIRYQSYNQAR